MNIVKRDPITGRFVSTKNNIEKPMYMKSNHEASEDEVSVTITEGKERRSVKKEEIVSILEANYGITGVTIEVDPNSIKVGRKVSNKMAGSDPAPKQKKVMTILAVVKGERIEKEFTEGEVISF